MLSQKAQILVVDDFATMRNIIRKCLKILGYIYVTEAENGKEALDILAEKDFDLVFLDWTMPEVNGIEVLKAIRKDPYLRDMGVIMITAESRDEDIRTAVEAGVDNYIVKPFTAEVLKNKMNKVFPD